MKKLWFPGSQTESLELYTNSRLTLIFCHMLECVFIVFREMYLEEDYFLKPTKE